MGFRVRVGVRVGARVTSTRSSPLPTGRSGRLGVARKGTCSGEQRASPPRRSRLVRGRVGVGVGVRVKAWVEVGVRVRVRVRPRVRLKVRVIAEQASPIGSGERRLALTEQPRGRGGAWLGSVVRVRVRPRVSVKVRVRRGVGSGSRAHLARRGAAWSHSREGVGRASAARPG